MTRFAAFSAIITMLALVPCSVQAQNFYSEIGYGISSYKKTDDEGSQLGYSPRVLRGIFGYEFTRYAGLEGLLSFKLGHIPNTVHGASLQDTDIQANLTMGLYLKGIFRLDKGFAMFARAGATSTAVTLKKTPFKKKLEENSLSWGLGTSYTFGNQLTLSMDYMQYLNKRIADADTHLAGTSIGLGYRF